MPRRIPLLISASIPTYHQRLLSQVRREKQGIMTLDIKTRKLDTLLWPVDEELNRIPLDEFRNHRRLRDFLGPCCLCPLFVQKGQEVYTEAAVFVATSGTYFGEYVAQCAEGKCGYFSPLETIFTAPSVLIKRYPAREPGNGCPLPVLHHTEREFELKFREATAPPCRQLKRTYAIADLDDFESIQRGEKRARAAYQDRRNENPCCLLQRLDTCNNPGLRREEFEALFVECDVCGLITTRLVFILHRCEGEVSEGEPELTEELTEATDTEELTDTDES